MPLKETDFLQIGDITFIFLERGDRHLIRVWNKQSETRKSFKGFKQYPVNPDYRIEAKYTSYDEPKMLRIQDVIEIHHEVPYQGNVAFDLDGEECCLEATGGEDYLFFSFKNQTTSETTFV